MRIEYRILEIGLHAMHNVSWCSSQPTIRIIFDYFIINDGSATAGMHMLA